MAVSGSNIWIVLCANCAFRLITWDEFAIITTLGNGKKCGTGGRVFWACRVGDEKCAAGIAPVVLQITNPELVLLFIVVMWNVDHAPGGILR